MQQRSTSVRTPSLRAFVSAINGTVPWIPEWAEWVADVGLGIALDLTYDATKKYSGQYFFDEMRESRMQDGQDDLLCPQLASSPRKLLRTERGTNHNRRDTADACSRLGHFRVQDYPRLRSTTQVAVMHRIIPLSMLDERDGSVTSGVSSVERRLAKLESLSPTPPLERSRALASFTLAAGPAAI